MSSYTHTQSKRINEVLCSFNTELFRKHNLLFGGGARIALEISEFRTPINVDILCPTSQSYAVIRENANQQNLGQLIEHNTTYLREIRFKMYSVTAFVLIDREAVKIEFMNFGDHNLHPDPSANLFPIPALDRASCFYTKLLANTDRNYKAPYQDIFDILAMTYAWGEIPNQVIELAEKTSSAKLLLKNLNIALGQLVKDTNLFKISAANLGIKAAFSAALLEQAYKLERTYQTVESLKK